MNPGLNIIPSSPEDSVYSVLQRLSTTEQQLALIRPNNPPPGIAGFIFDIVGNERMRLVSEITDYYIEDNTSIQDQAALRPESVTVRGFVAELVFVAPKEDRIARTTNPLGPNAAMTPILSPTATQDQAQTDSTKASASEAVEAGQSLYGVYQRLAGQKPNQTRQAQVFGYFYQLWLGRQMFTVETPWGVMTNMMIEVADFEQPEETKFTTEMAITFKRVRIAQAAQVQIGQIAGRADYQRAPVTQNGPAGQTPTTAERTQSLLRLITHPTP